MKNFIDNNESKRSFATNYNNPIMGKAMNQIYIVSREIA